MPWTKYACLWLVLAGTHAALAADNELTSAQKAAGWRLLFDGKSYAGWEDPTRKSPPGDSFTIENGCLKATSHPRIDEDLFTTDTFRDFELELDWKISPAGNSGIKYRIQDRLLMRDEKLPKFEDMVALSFRNRPTVRPAKGQEYVIGFEYQITDNSSNPDATKNGPRYSAGALYSMFAPSSDVTKPVGEFNHTRLVVQADHIEHWLNGTKVVDASLRAPEVGASLAKRWGEGSAVYDLLTRQPRAECQISLQNHGDLAWFKNVRVRVIR